MAVLDNCPGLEVNVIANHNALPEYDDSQAADQQNTVTKFVEVDRDGAFEVHFQFTDAYTCRYGVRVEIRLDGHKVDSVLCRQSQLKKDTGHTFEGARSKIGNRWHVSNFKFSQFVLDLNARRELDQTTLQRLRSTGVITVLVHRIKNLVYRRASTRSSSDKPHGITKFRRVPEKAVQDLGLSHHGSVARPKREKPGVRTLCYNNVDGKEDEHAIAIFNFKYRSLAILQSLGIAAAPPPPAVLPWHPRTPAAQSTPAPPAVYPAVPAYGPHIPAVGAPDPPGLSTTELLVLVKAYRGSVNGLESLSRKDLTILLEHHRKPSP